MYWFTVEAGELLGTGRPALGFCPELGPNLCNQLVNDVMRKLCEIEDSVDCLLLECWPTPSQEQGLRWLMGRRTRARTYWHGFVGI